MLQILDPESQQPSKVQNIQHMQAAYLFIIIQFTTKINILVVKQSTHHHHNLPQTHTIYQMHSSLTNSQIRPLPIPNSNFANYKQACQRIIGNNDKDRGFSCGPNSRLSDQSDNQPERLSYKDIQSITKTFLKDRKAHEHNFGVLQNIKGKMYCLKLGEVSNFKQFSHYFYTSQYRRKFSKNQQPGIGDCLGINLRQKYRQRGDKLSMNKMKNANMLKTINPIRSNINNRLNKLSIKITTQPSQNMPQYPHTNPEREMGRQMDRVINTQLDLYQRDRDQQDYRNKWNENNNTNEYLKGNMIVNRNQEVDGDGDNEQSDQELKDWRQMTSIGELNVDDKMKQRINKLLLPVLTNSSINARPNGHAQLSGQKDNKVRDLQSNLGRKCYNKEKLKQIQNNYNQKLAEQLNNNRKQIYAFNQVKATHVQKQNKAGRHSQVRKYYSVHKIL